MRQGTAFDMKVLIFKDAALAALRAAERVAVLLKQMNKPVLGLATGATMEPVYAELVAMHQAGTISFARAASFNLDEYVGLAPDHHHSFHQTMQQFLFDHVDFAPGACHLPDGSATDPASEARRYDEAIQKAGGIDLQLLGIGRNGHIGFNEPISSLGARTRVKTLTANTRQANAGIFGSPEAVPRYAITMGLANILEAGECVLLATGAVKADAVAKMIEGPVASICPASILQLHPRATIILDREAAGNLDMIDYYLEIHPDGEEPEIV